MQADRERDKESTLSLSGVSSAATVIEGQIVGKGSSVVIAISDLEVDASASSVAGCYRVALLAAEGAQVNAADVVVLNADGSGGICLIFADDFESGDTSAWSATVSGGIGIQQWKTEREVEP